MKKLIWGLAVFLLIVVGAIVVGPSMINWNAYKGDVAEQVKALTGRDLKILGNVEVSIFPAPAIIANDVSLSNMEGAATPEMITLQRAEVRIALGPLFAGQIKVETVRLIKPVIELEISADGRQNWNFQPPASKENGKPSANQSSQSADSADMSVPSVVLDDFTIVDGSLNYRDSARGTIERIEGLNARVEAASLSGPFQSKGSLTLRSIPLTYDITVGEVIKKRTLPLTLDLGIGAGDSSLHIGGVILGLTDNPKFKGSVKGQGQNLGLLIEAMTRSPTPPALAQLFAVEGNVTASVQGVEISGLTMRLADSRIAGDIAVDMSDIPRFSVSLTAGRFDLDKWLNTQSTALNAVKKRSKKRPAVSTKPDKKPIEQPVAKAGGGILIPKGIIGSVIVSVEALVYRGESISDVLISTDLADGAATLNQFSAQFPGGSEIAMSGLLTSPKGRPTFSGSIETTTNDLRKVVAWLGVKMPDIPTDRLRKINFRSDVSLTPEEVRVQNIDLKFDSSRLTGAATIALRSRPAFGVNLTLDQINADAYMPPPSNLKPGKSIPKTKVQNADKGTEKVAKSEKKPPTSNPLIGLSALANFDANVLMKIKRLRLRGEQIKDIDIDATLYDGSLDVRKINVGQVVGAGLSVSGKINELRSIPVAKGLQIKLKTKNLTPLVRFAGITLPFDVRNMGATSVDLRADGSFGKPKIQTNIKTAGAKIDAKGVVSLLSAGDLFDLTVDIEHPDFARLLRTFGVKYRPSGKIGGIKLSTQVKGDPKNLFLEQLSGNLGKLSFGGTGAVQLAGPKPKITADLKTGALILDKFLPATSKADLGFEIWQSLKRRPVVWPGPDLSQKPTSLIQIANKGRWSQDPIDLSFLNDFDADIALKSPIVAISRYLFEKVDVSAEITNGTLKTKRLLAGLFGGQLQGNGQISADKTNHVSSAFNITGIQISEALKAVTGEATASGLLDANLDFSASGQSVAGLISALGGTGGFSMKNVDASIAAKGSVFSGVYSLLSSLNRLGSSRSGNKADVSGTFQIARGVARTNDLKLVSSIGNGLAKGTVDLPGWLLNIKGQIELHQGALTQILQAKLTGGASPVEFVVSGPLDTPKVKIDTGALLGGGVPIPGADVIFNKAPKGIGNILKGIIGGGTVPPPAPSNDNTSGSAPEADTPPPPRSTTSPQQEPTRMLRPEDLLKQLFK